MPGILRRTRAYLEFTLRPPGYFVDFLNFASDFAPDQLSDSGKLASFPRKLERNRMEHQTPSGFPGNFRKRKVLGTLWFPFWFPETSIQAKLRRMAERHSFWPPGLRAVAARRSKALSSSAPPCQISPHAPTRPGSACRNDAGMMDGCGEHASGTAAHSQGRSRLSREGRGSGRVRESRGARRARARAW